MKTALISRKEIEAVQAAYHCGVAAALDIIAPWACAKRRATDNDGKVGYMVFESMADFETWGKQK